MLEILLIIVGGLLFFVWYSTWTFNYWKERKVVSRKPYPVFGTIISDFRKRLNPSVALQVLYNEFPDEKLIGGFLSSRPILMIKDPEIIKQVLIKDFDSFADRGFQVNFKEEPLMHHLFFANSDVWRPLRQKLSPTFTSGKMRKMFPLMVECGEEFENYLKAIMEQGKTPEIKDLVGKYTMDVIGSCAFGIKINSTRENAEFRLMSNKVFETSVVNAIKGAIQQIFPKLFNLLGFRFLGKDIETYFLKLIQSIMNIRDNKPSTRGDFIDLLIELKLKGYIPNDKNLVNKLDQIEMTDELLSAQAFVFLIAGYETSSSTISFALHELAFNQDIQTKVAKEIETVLSKYDGKITYDALKEMKYVQMVMDESLRKYPPFGLLSRLCMKQCQLTGTDVTIDKGIIVQIPIYSLHNDPKHFQDSEKFIPERFSSDLKESINPYVYLPFGEGPRNCIGLRFARLQSMVGLISILRNNKKVVPSKLAKRELEFAADSFILCSKNGIHLDFEPRR